MKLKTKLFGLLALLLMLCTVAMSAKKVHTLGDSTMAPYDESATVTRGWGMYFGNRPGTDGLDKSLTETVTVLPELYPKRDLSQRQAPLWVFTTRAFPPCAKK